MENFVYHNPTKIIFGEQSYYKLSEVLFPQMTILFVYGGESCKKSGLYDTLLSLLASCNVTVVEHGGVHPNPLLSHAREGIEKAKNRHVDAIIAVGGGSVMDEAKAIAAGAMVDHDIWDFYTRIASISQALPLFCIPTLAATGSEMNGNSVITHDETRQKFNINALSLYPICSFLAPELTFTLSPQSQANASVDAMAHVLEGYLTHNDKNELIERQCEALLKTLMKSTEKIFRFPQNFHARSQFMWAATCALNTSVQIGYKSFSFPNHILELPLSGLYDISHGAGLSIIMPAWMRWYYPHNPRMFERLAKKLFQTKNIVEGIDRLEAWFMSIGAPIRLSDVGIDESRFDELAQMAHELANLRGGLGDFYTVSTCKEIYKLAL